MSHWTGRLRHPSLLVPAPGPVFPRWAYQRSCHPPYLLGQRKNSQKAGPPHPSEILTGCSQQLIWGLVERKPLVWGGLLPFPLFFGTPGHWPLSGMPVSLLTIIEISQYIPSEKVGWWCLYVWLAVYFVCVPRNSRQKIIETACIVCALVPACTLGKRTLGNPCDFYLYV